MNTINSIKEDLNEIKYYYARKKMFDLMQHDVGKSAIYEKVERYNNTICKAPARLYDLYTALYVDNNSQTALSDTIGYSPEYISRLNSKLIKFLLDNLD